jgi:hypothetical protein
LPARFLQRHVETRQRVEVLLRPGDFFSLRESHLGFEILHAHELLLAQFAKGLEVFGHGRILGGGRSIAKVRSH